jgi:hypothetical protein
MAKADRNAGDKPAKTRKSKMSKELSTAVDKLGKLAQEPLAREIVVAAAGAALAARKDARKAAKKGARAVGDEIGDSPAASAWLGAAITAAAVEAGRRLLDAYDKSQAAGNAGGVNGDEGNGEPQPRALKADKAKRRRKLETSEANG